MIFMFESSCYDNAYIDKFRAKVIFCKLLNENVVNNRKYKTIYEVRIDKSFFYPGGGGQDADIAKINGKDIIYFIDSHTFYIEDYLVPDIEYECCLDLSIRYDLMQQHTAEHIISGLAHKYYSCNNIGFHMNKKIVTMDIDKILSEEQLDRLIMETNKICRENHKVITSIYSSDEDIDQEYRSKQIFDGSIRLVTIDGVDCCACCALHVGNTNEIGIVQLISYEKYKGGQRLTILAADRAVNYINKNMKIISELNTCLSCQNDDLLNRVNILANENRILKKNINLLKTETFEIKIKEILFGNNSKKGLVYKCSNIDTNLVSRSSKYIQKLVDINNLPINELLLIFSENKENKLFYLNFKYDSDNKPIYTCLLNNPKVKCGGNVKFLSGTLFMNNNEIDEFIQQIELLNNQ